MTMEIRGEGTLVGTRAGLRPARPEDLPAVLALLERGGLPTAGVADGLPHFVVAEHEGVLVGAAGLEVYGADGLLRSVVVAPEWRGRGLGRALTDRILADAVRLGVRTMYLLTTTAERYFPRHGFRVIPREDVAGSIRDSVEFREACPASASVMVRAAGTPPASS